MLAEIKEMVENFVKDAEKFEDKGVKAAGRRSRVISSKLSQKLKEWRKYSLEKD